VSVDGIKGKPNVAMEKLRERDGIATSEAIRCQRRPKI